MTGKAKGFHEQFLYEVIPDPEPEVARRVRLVVCSRARDVADAATLLDTLGLGPAVGA